MSMCCTYCGGKFRKGYYSHEGLRLEIEKPHYDATGVSHRYVNAECSGCNRWGRIGKVIDPDTKKRT